MSSILSPVEQLDAACLAFVTAHPFVTARSVELGDELTQVGQRSGLLYPIGVSTLTIFFRSEEQQQARHQQIAAGSVSSINGNPSATIETITGQGRSGRYRYDRTSGLVTVNNHRRMVVGDTRQATDEERAALSKPPGIINLAPRNGPFSRLLTDQGVARLTERIMLATTQAVPSRAQIISR